MFIGDAHCHFDRQGLVEVRTGDYLAEKKKAEALLYQLLPA